MSPAVRVSDRLRDERGMTLIELMMSVTLGTLIILAGYAAMSAATSSQTRAEHRIDAVQRGRVAMESITRDLRSQVCLPAANTGAAGQTPPMRWASDDGMEFYASLAPLTAGAQPLEIRRIAWTQTGGPLNPSDPTSLPVGDIVETVWRSPQAVAPYTFPTTPTARNVLASSVERTVTGGVPQPFFRYYGYDVAPGQSVGRPSATPMAMVASGTSTINPTGAPSLDDTNRPRVVLVDVQFNARSLAAKVVDRGRTFTSTKPSPVVPFFNRVSVRNADSESPGATLCA